MKKAHRGASRARMSFGDARTCTHGTPAFIKRRRTDGSTYTIPVVVDMCGAPAPVTFTRDGNIQYRCTRHAGT